MKYFHLMAIMIAALIFAGCSPRVSYSVRVLHEDPVFTGRLLSEADIVVFPLIGAEGVLAVEGLEPENVASSLRLKRADLKIVPYAAFEAGFPARFDMRVLDDFHAGIFRGDVLAVKATDDVWNNVKQPYLMVFSLMDGASVRNIDASTFKHVTVKCELWSRDGRAVVWRASCKGVSDDGATSDARLIYESMIRLAETIPAAMPNYGREDW